MFLANLFPKHFFLKKAASSAVQAKVNGPYVLREDFAAIHDLSFTNTKAGRLHSVLLVSLLSSKADCPSISVFNKLGKWTQMSNCHLGLAFPSLPCNQQAEEDIAQVYFSQLGHGLWLSSAGRQIALSTWLKGTAFCHLGQAAENVPGSSAAALPHPWLTGGYFVPSKCWCNGVNPPTPKVSLPLLWTC